MWGKIPEYSRNRIIRIMSKFLNKSPEYPEAGLDCCVGSSGEVKRSPQVSSKLLKLQALLQEDTELCKPCFHLSCCPPRLVLVMIVRRIDRTNRTFLAVSPWRSRFLELGCMYVCVCVCRVRV